MFGPESAYFVLLLFLFQLLLRRLDCNSIETGALRLNSSKMLFSMSFNLSMSIFTFNGNESQIGLDEDMEADSQPHHGAKRNCPL